MSLVVLLVESLAVTRRFAVEVLRVADDLVMRAGRWAWTRLRRAVLLLTTEPAVVIAWYPDGRVEVENRTDRRVSVTTSSTQAEARIRLWLPSERDPWLR